MATLSVEAPTTSGQIDARPIVPRTTGNLWSKAEASRDRLYAEFLNACEAEAVEALVLKSDPYLYPPWVKFECWIPQQDRALSERASATITLQSRPYHSHEFEYHMELSRRGTTKTVRGAASIDGPQVREVVRYLLERGSRPRFRRFRQHPLQFWRPRNKVIGLKRDWLAVIPTLLVVAGFAPTRFGLLFWAAAALTFWWLRRRPVYVRTQGKPMGEPRFLARVDSWQTVVFGLGRDCPLVRERLSTALEKVPEHFRSQVERVWHWGLDGKEEREQIALSFGRGVVFCQVYPYGEDLYVGWDGHLNVGQWVEQTVATGVDRTTGLRVKLNTVVSGTQQITEYDVIDLSCLMEWTHAQIVKMLKQLVEERHIDQEIDFKILRGERQKLAELGKREEKPLGALRGRLGLKRTA